MKKFIQIAALSLMSIAATVSHANDDAIKASITKSMPAAKIGDITETPLKGIYEVSIGAETIYMSGDGRYAFQGHLIDLEGKKDLTEEKLSAARKKAIAGIGNNMIVFKPKIAKYTVTIFTDIDCGYCRKLHSELDTYLAEGITIQYLFYPRAGKDSESYHKAVAVWCAKDRNAALTAAKKDEKLDMKTCENPVDEHMKLAEMFQLRGTPMIVTEKGNTYPGYMPAKQLLEALQAEESN
ncbi:bifunctional protein-disulfide isomerase/oxidoreductase DsbC [Methylosoma difficile]